MQKGIVVFVFANYLDNVLVWNYAMSGFKRGVEKAGMGSGKDSYRIYLDYLKIFAYISWSFGQCYDDSFVCLSEARTKRQ
jgi:hypothetical protein